jgi:uncharacterized protein YdeI (YjbR/CyaY-like superfamily)
VSPAPDYPILLFADRTAFRKWLSAHHSSDAGIWLRIAEGASQLVTVEYHD